MFGNGGVDNDPVTTGRKFFSLTTQSTTINMQPQRVDLEFDDLMTSDGVPLDFHAVATIQVTDSVKLVRNFGGDGSLQGVFSRNLEQPFRTAVRDEVKQHGMNEMAINTTAAEEVDAAATEHLTRIIRDTGVPIKLIDISLGRANPPDSIKSQRVETATQEQRINTEKQRKLAEDQRKAAEESRAAADSAYNYKMNLSPNQYLQLESIKMWREVCGTGKCTVFTGGSGVLPTLDVTR